jgi:hypothetical protein
MVMVLTPVDIAIQSLKQGAQIGRILAKWALVDFGQQF